MCQCHGTGVIVTTDWVDYGSALVPMEQIEVCDCVFNSGCPRCGSECVEEYKPVCTVRCSKCDWEVGQ